MCLTFPIHLHPSVHKYKYFLHFSRRELYFFLATGPFTWCGTRTHALVSSQGMFGTSNSCYAGPHTHTAFVKTV
jgi:hypothetical protein